MSPSWKPLTLLVSLALLACSSSDSSNDTGSVTPPGAGSGGSAQGGQAGGKTAGSGGSGQAGTAGGAPSCGCQTVKCGSGQRCVEGECFSLQPGQCFQDSDCPNTLCLGASICPCEAPCAQGTNPGFCEGIVGTGGAAGSGGSSAGGQAGQGGGPDVCCPPGTCGDEQLCVGGECFDLQPGQCFKDSDCNGAACLGAFVCPCNADCAPSTKPGTCANAQPDWASCGAPGECVLASATCCGTCSVPKVGDVHAVNQKKLAAHQQEVCPEPTPCPACAETPNPDLLAICALGPGKCAVLEVSKSSFSACTDSSQCTLEVNQCCACGTQPVSSLVALHVGQVDAYRQQLPCALVDCGACSEPPHAPPGVGAACVNSHCVVTM